MNNNEICQFCNLSVKDKYTLKTHILKSKSCLKKRGLSLETKYICKGCQHISSNNTNLIMHTENCKEYIILKIKDECKEEYEKQINKLKNEISELTIKFENIQKTQDKALVDACLQIDKLQKMICDIASKAVDKSTSIIYKSVENEINK